MSFDWSEYLYLAQELTVQTTSASGQEARLRSAISRAYYATFCKARNHLRDREQRGLPGGGQIHWYVINQFKYSSGKEHKKIGHILDRLRIDRNKADYVDTVTRLFATTEADLKLAEQAISKLDNL